MRRASLRKAFLITGRLDPADLPPLGFIPADQPNPQCGKDVKPSPSGMWWFLDQVKPEERALVNKAGRGLEAAQTIQALYGRYPKLAAEALRH